MAIETGNLGKLGSTAVGAAAQISILGDAFERLVGSLPLQQLLELEKTQNQIGIQASTLSTDYEKLDQTVRSLSSSTGVLSRIQATNLIASFRDAQYNIRITNEEMIKFLNTVATRFPTAYAEYGRAAENFAESHLYLQRQILSGKFSFEAYQLALREGNVEMVAFERGLSNTTGGLTKTTTEVKTLESHLKNLYLSFSQSGNGITAWAASILGALEAFSLIKKFGGFGKAAGVVGSTSAVAAEAAAVETIGTRSRLASFGRGAGSLVGKLLKQGMATAVAGGESLLTIPAIAVGLAADLAIRTAAINKEAHTERETGEALYGANEAESLKAAIAAGDVEAVKRISLKLGYAPAVRRAALKQAANNQAAKVLDKSGVGWGALHLKAETPEQRQVREAEAIDAERKGLRELQQADEQRLQIRENEMRILELQNAPIQRKLEVTRKEVEILNTQETIARKIYNDTLAANNNDKDNVNVRKAQIDLQDIQMKKLEKVQHVRRSMLEQEIAIGMGGGSYTMPGGLARPLAQSGYSAGAMQTLEKGKPALKQLNPTTGKVETVSAATTSLQQQWESFGVPYASPLSVEASNAGLGRTATKEKEKEVKRDEKRNEFLSDMLKQLQQLNLSLTRS